MESTQDLLLTILKVYIYMSRDFSFQAEGAAEFSIRFIMSWSSIAAVYLSHMAKTRSLRCISNGVRHQLPFVSL